MWFPIGGPLEPCVYLAPLWRYWTPKIKGSQVWPFAITWRHRSRDHRTRRGHFPISGQWWSCIFFAQIQRYRASKILGSRVWPFGVTWRHRSCDHSTRHMWFPIGGPLEPCVYLAPLRSYKASNLHLPMLKAKSSVCMRHVTWPVGRWSKITTYLEFPSPHCLFIGTNLIHDFTAVTFSVKLTSFREKCWFPWNPCFFVNFSAFSAIYDNSRVLSAAFVQMLLFATCRTLALSSWHWLSWVLTWWSKYSLFWNCFVCISAAPRNNVCVAREFPKLFPWIFCEIWHILKILLWNHAFFPVNSVGPYLFTIQLLWGYDDD